MRNPRRVRNIALVACLAGAAATTAAFTIPDAGPGFTLQAALGIGGLTSGVLGFVVALFTQIDARRKARLMRGDDVIARWRVDPARWHAFVHLNEKLDTERGALRNHLSIRRNAPAAGIEVIVAKAALQVDGDFHALSFNGNPAITSLTRQPGPPPYLEFRLSYTGADYSASLDWALRFPIAAGSESDAARVQSHYSRSFRPRRG